MSLRRSAFLSALLAPLCTLLVAIPHIAAQTPDTPSANQSPATQGPTANSQLQLTHKEARCSDLAAMHPPKYHVFDESRTKRDDGSEAVDVKLSLHRNDFTEAKVEAVSCELRRKYRHEAFLDVWMVDDEHAVKHARGWDKDDPAVQHEFRVHLIVTTRIGETTKKESQTASFNWFPDREDRQHATDVVLQ